MLTLDEFPHHDAHHYENDEKHAAILLLFLGVFSVFASLFIAGVAAGY